MFRIDKDGAVAVMPVPAAVDTPGYFDTGTLITSDWLNAVQEEVLGVIENLNAGSVADKASQGQLVAALRDLEGIVAAAADTGVASTTRTRALIASATSQVSGAASVIGGSTGSTAAGAASAILGSVGGTIDAAATCSAIIGATGSTIDSNADYACIAASDTSTLGANANSACAAILATSKGVLDGTYSAILAAAAEAVGDLKIVSATRAVILGSYGSTADPCQITADATNAAIVASEKSVINEATNAAIVASSKIRIDASSGVNLAAVACDADAYDDLLLSGSQVFAAALAATDVTEISGAQAFILGCETGIATVSGDQAGAIACEGEFDIQSDDTLAVASNWGTAGAVAINRPYCLVGGTSAGVKYAIDSSTGKAEFLKLRVDDAVALGGGAAPTLGTIGGSGPGTQAQAQWLVIDIGGTPHFVPVWV